MQLTIGFLLLFCVCGCITDLIMYRIHTKNAKKACFDCDKCGNWDCMSKWCGKSK